MEYKQRRDCLKQYAENIKYVRIQIYIDNSYSKAPVSIKDFKFKK